MTASRTRRITGRALAVAAALGTLLAADATAYVRSITPDAGAPMEWNTRRIPYLINENGSDDMDFDTVEEQVELSFAPWAAEDCAELRFIYDGPTAGGQDPVEDIGYDGDNIVVFREEPDLWTFDSDVIAVTTVSFCEGVGGECDLAGEILDADIEVNGFNFSFSVSDIAPRTRFDLRNTLTHEVGHLLGFDHTPVTEATMFASAPPGETSKRDLHPDDIDGLCDVYAAIYSERSPDDPQACSALPGRGGPDGWPLLLVGLGLLGLRRR